MDIKGLNVTDYDEKTKFRKWGYVKKSSDLNSVLHGATIGFEFYEDYDDMTKRVLKYNNSVGSASDDTAMSTKALYLSSITDDTTGYIP